MMWDGLFHTAWFGRFSVLFPHEEEQRDHAGLVYNDGPLDGLISTSIWSQRFAQIPIVNYTQATPSVMGAGPTLRPPGTPPAPTGAPWKAGYWR